MKTNKVIVALLVAILAIQSVGVVLTVMEEREQTRIVQQTAELTYIQTEILSQSLIDTLEMTDLEFKMCLQRDYEINELGKKLNEKLWDSLHIQ